ncbi:CPBP family intramembrane metalloprotease [Candidatus Micrarchaeota archaeon]|nr:CPBP family intramembrane metalloprotease [Candidatus Micrarchaeota archaeon]
MIETLITVLSIAFIPIFLLLFFEKTSLKQVPRKLGFVYNKNTLFNSLKLFLYLLIALFLVNAILAFLGLSDEGKIIDFIKTKSILTLLIAITLSPIVEEMLFRGYLVPRIGVVFSSLVFGGLHYAYGSTTQIIGTIIAGIILGLNYRKNKDLTSCIIAHALYNATSLMLFFYL